MKNITLLIIGAALTISCGEGHQYPHSPDGDNNGKKAPESHKHHGHDHDAPNGGTMVEFGEDACHLEFLRDESNASRINILAYEFHPKLNKVTVKVPFANGCGEQIQHLKLDKVLDKVRSWQRVSLDGLD